MAARYVEVRLDAVRVALPLADIDRIVRAVAIAAVPGAGHCLRGVIDVAGTVLPVHDLRILLGLPPRELRASDRMVLTRGPQPRALLVDEVTGALDIETADLPDSTALRAAGLRGVARREDGLLLVHDFSRLLGAERAIPLQCHADA